VIASAEAPSWIRSLSALLTARRIRAHAIILALGLWGVYAYDYATPGIIDRQGNVKFQDFLQFPISARLIAQGQAHELYDDRVLAQEIRQTIGRDTNIYLQYFYGPQVALTFIPLARMPFLAQAALWSALSLLLYFACVYLIWRRCAGLASHGKLVAICAIAYPPLFHFFVRGQLSAIVLLCFTAGYLALASGRNFIAGIALGCLALKPQFLVAISLIFLLARAWSAFVGLLASSSAQLGFTSLYFGREVMESYLRRLLHSAGHPGSTELIFSPMQMHSLHSFWEMLIPWPPAQWALYISCSLLVIFAAAAVWRSPSQRALRFSALTFAAVLVNPHIYVYDLLALAPALLLLADWSIQNAERALKPYLDVLLYLAFLLPLFGPLAYWTHLQLSVIVFAALLWTLHRIGRATMIEA
jgi:alpha-1,2-mannosyltransferase